MDGNGQYSVAEMAVDESQERRQHLPFLVRCRCMDFGKDDLAQSALKPYRTFAALAADLELWRDYQKRVLARDAISQAVEPEVL
jgi:hypothetical protein